MDLRAVPRRSTTWAVVLTPPARVGPFSVGSLVRPIATKRITVESIGSYFESLTDPRHAQHRNHLFIDIMVIAVCGLVCGYDGPTTIRRWTSRVLIS
ncbi:transposase family protein [Gemmata sp. G18]|uniref:Transposase family protein n=1 Tax=Gemmata palustris TaxID=2822762 RepID=A0ABS5BNH7_9BACT|nr:transposase family protein [Gemmata palustris]MBP3954403.1 transposase family protein [Gemmata palustris]